VTDRISSAQSRIRATVSRPERLLPFACLAAAGLLFASEAMTMFEFTPPGGEPVNITQTGAEQHGNALYVIAGFAVVLLAIAVLGSSKAAAIGVATMGLIALGFFLIGDLPDAGQVGTVDDARQSFIDAEAEPQAGFWLEMVGALALAISGIALATLSPDQLGALRPWADRSDTDQALEPPTPAPVAAGNPGHGNAESDSGAAGEAARARQR
jgi:hypothetical protein